MTKIKLKNITKTERITALFMAAYQGHVELYKLIMGKLTGKFFSEALILASIHPQYDKRLFITLEVQHMKIASSEHG